MSRRIPTLAALALLAGVAAAASLAAATQFSPWGAPVSAESLPGTSSALNTPSLDGCPILSPDRLSLYMASDRPGGMGGLDIWVARRASPSAPFGAPVNAGAPVNSGSDDFCPSPMDGNSLFFVSSRPGGCGDADIYVTLPDEQGGWSQPQHLGCHVNSPGQEASPFLLERDATGDALLYFSSNRPGGYAADAGTPDGDLYVSRLTRFGFGPAQLVPGLNTAANELRPNLSHDGLEIVFDSNRSGTLGGQDIYTAERATLGDAWSSPVNLGAVNTSAMETRASMSSDGTTLLFGSNRAGGEGSTDIYTATRSPSTRGR